MSDLYEWEDGRLFVNGEYRAVLESKTDDDGICHHVTGLCNEDADEAFARGYKAGMDFPYGVCPLCNERPNQDSWCPCAECLAAKNGKLESGSADENKFAITGHEQLPADLNDLLCERCGSSACCADIEGSPPVGDHIHCSGKEQPNSEEQSGECNATNLADVAQRGVQNLTGTPPEVKENTPSFTSVKRNDTFPMVADTPPESSGINAPAMRKGQAVFNLVDEHWPHIANQLRGGDVDCYHRDSLVPQFLCAVVGLMVGDPL